MKKIVFSILNFLICAQISAQQSSVQTAEPQKKVQNLLYTPTQAVTQAAQIWGMYTGTNLAHEGGHALVGTLSGNRFGKIIIGNPQTSTHSFIRPRFEYHKGDITTAAFDNIRYAKGSLTPHQIPMLLSGPIAGMGASYGLLKLTGEDSPWRYYPHAASLLQLGKYFNVVSLPKILAATAVLKTADDIIIEYLRTKNMKQSVKNVAQKSMFDDNKLLSIAATTLFLNNVKQLTGDIGTDFSKIIQSLKLSNVNAGKTYFGVFAANKLANVAILSYGIKKYIERAQQEAAAREAKKI